MNKLCTCSHEKKGAGVLDDLLIYGLVRSLPSVSLPTSRTFTNPSTVKVPCISKDGALDDYIYIVLGYQYFNGGSCWDLLPPA